MAIMSPSSYLYPARYVITFDCPVCLGITVQFALEFAIYPNDHRPAHVHVMGNGYEAVFSLHCPDGPVELRENFGFPAQELGPIRAALIADLAYLCNEWRKFHGNP